MNKIFLAVTVAAGILSWSSLARAGQGILVMPEQPFVAQTPPDVIGQSYPAFTGATTPVVSIRIATSVAGQSYPTFVGQIRQSQSFGQIPRENKLRARL